MFRRLAALTFAALLLPAPAFADVDWSLYKSFAHTRCEDAKTIADIKESAKGLRFDNNGVLVFSVTHGIRLLSSTTLRADASTLVCRLKVQATTNGAGRTYSGKYTVHIYPGGKWRTNFDWSY